MAYEELLDEIRQLLDGRRWKDVRARIEELPDQDIAELILSLEKSQRIFLFKLLPRPRASEVFSYLSGDNQDALLQDMTDHETREIVAALTPDDRTALFQELPAEATQRLLELLPPGAQREARELLGYPAESVGRLMTPDYIAVRADWTVERSLQHIRGQREKAETVNVIYVTDRDGRLLDALTIRRFIVASPETKVEELMDYHFISVSAFEDREKAVETVQRYDLTALPVVDTEGVLLGTVTPDDVMDVAEAEATEDFQKVGGVGVLNFSMRDASMKLLYQRRVGWLVLLVFINMFGGEIIASFEETIEAVIVLVTFLPLVVDTGGNAGTQSATLMVRALATGDVKARDWLRLWGKEAGVAIALGLTVGLAVWALGLYRGGLDIAWVVAFAMVAVVFMGSMIGMLLPFGLARLNLDPATASAPLITSIADIAGILIYFTIATAMLGHML
ncbi:MAG: magnesium transporter [Halorhodospira halophila]|uniref:magnesium transporter n=1 Tax=Halorhodospira TaxID=85108 RepID=UPI001912EA15|nr:MULTISPECIES: magnesium transporter [Halorhodospira]MBK5935804.1 magnesium transporter [Halorhodospira halophila]MBK5943027.1 magnesium transporter [Halorhodospira halophila]MCC3751428.1 magnesium transporter [Halorhodospira halophila]MCG5528518.1 magnesium transporter [Halorhodospira halophila]MCG5533822.1 magnesium transporter [Halorhodospira sp. 9621]